MSIEYKKLFWGLILFEVIFIVVLVGVFRPLFHDLLVMRYSEMVGHYFYGRNLQGGGLWGIVYVSSINPNLHGVYWAFYRWFNGWYVYSLRNDIFLVLGLTIGIFILLLLGRRALKTVLKKKGVLKNVISA